MKCLCLCLYVFVSACSIRFRSVLYMPPITIWPYYIRMNGVRYYMCLCNSFVWQFYLMMFKISWYRGYTQMQYALNKFMADFPSPFPTVSRIVYFFLCAICFLSFFHFMFAFLAKAMTFFWAINCAIFLYVLMVVLWLPGWSLIESQLIKVRYAHIH